MIADYWRKSAVVDIDPLDLEFEFPREIPMNLSEEIDRIARGRGHVPLETLYAQTSFIDDPEAEARALEDEGSIIPGLENGGV